MKFFEREVYIRIADDQAAFVCTVKYRKLYSKATSFALQPEPAPETVDEKPLVSLLKRSSPWAL